MSHSSVTADMKQNGSRPIDAGVTPGRLKRQRDPGGGSDGKNGKNGKGPAKDGPADKGRMKQKDYEKGMKKLQGELVKVQLWAKHTGAKIVVLFEGRDAAGKGGVIKAITERTSPRVYRIAALPAPTERQRSQMYMQRYIELLPAAGEIILFDRSWYNRAGVESVMGFCKPGEVRRFLTLCPRVEATMIGSGIQLIKYWFEVSQKEQTRRFE